MLINERVRLPSVILIALVATTLYSNNLAAPSGLAKRERVPDDATKAGEVVKWLKEKTPVARDRSVFFSSSTKGRPMADTFCAANPGYKAYWQIFDQQFMNNFGLNQMDDDF